MTIKDSIDTGGYLVTGGTGSFGKAFVKRLLNNDETKNERIVIYSRDELKQWEMMQELPNHKYPNLRYFIGDVRDQQRLRRAMQKIRTVIHAAALKQVPAAEYNPMECIKTNVLGAENIVQACLDSGVEKVVALSTDKAAAPINLYGATKLCSDKLLIAANNIRGEKNIKFSVVRYGNVMGSRGSVIPYFMKKAREGVLPITNPEMTRFNISIAEGVEMVMWAIKNSLGGELFVPKIPSYKITDLAEAIGPNCQKQIIGIRPGEKIHEEMITSSDSYSTIDLNSYYAILPSDGSIHERYKKHKKSFTEIEKGFSYNSGTNTDFLGVEQIRELIKVHIDKDFKPS